MRKIIIAILLTFICLWVTGQQATINGYVKDATNGEVLIGATVLIKGTSKGTITNPYGFYSLSVPPGEYTIQYNYLGYTSADKEITLQEDQYIIVELQPTQTELEEVVITAEGKNENIVSSKMSNVALTSKTIDKIPVLLGEADVIKSLMLMPGVKATGEISSNLSIRGGARDQNMLLLDEATVYNASHLVGIFSIFNNDALNNVEMYKGIMPVEYGGRISSLIDIRMKDGNFKKFSGSGGIGSIASRLTLEVPVVKDKGSVMISGRRTYIDLMMKLMHSIDSTIPELPIYFYDLNMKANYALSPKHRIFLSGYFGRDAADLSFNDDASTKFVWGNYTTTFRWNYIITRRLFSNLTLLASNYDYKIENSFTLGREKKEYYFKWDAFLKDYSIKIDMGYFVNPSSTVKFGISSTYHDFNVGQVNGHYDTTNFNYLIPKVYCREHAGYIGNEYKIEDLLTFDYGLRLTLLENIGNATVHTLTDYEVTSTTTYEKGKIYNRYYGLEPRFSVSYIMNERQSVKAGYARTRQYMQVASNAISGTPLDVWIPAGPNIKPQFADQVSIGYFRNFKENKVKASIEVYYKDMKNQIEFKEFSQPYLNPEIEEEFRFGKGRSYGLELLIEKPEGKWTGWISYTLSKSERKTNDIQEKGWYLSPYDSPHDISIVSIYQVMPRLSLSVNWVYLSGKPVNSPVARWEYGNLILPYYPGRNNDRLPAYHRLDLGLEYKFKPKKRFQSSVSLSIYNAYNRKNYSTVSFTQDNLNPNITSATGISILPMIVSSSFNFKF